MTTLTLSNGAAAEISPEDTDLAERRWHVTAGYAARAVWAGGRRTIYLHRVIAERMGIVGLVDHANRDRLDNRRENLRPATYSQNAGNRMTKAATGAIGVTVDKRRGTFSAEVARDGERHRKAGFSSVAAASEWRTQQLARLGTY